MFEGRENFTSFAGSSKLWENYKYQHKCLKCKNTFCSKCVRGYLCVKCKEAVE